MPILFWLYRLLVVLFLCIAGFASAAPLPALGADPKVTVSGLSAGAFMAVQYGTAFSASTRGVGVVAGGPYNCAAIYFALGSTYTCMQSVPSGTLSYNSAQWFARLGRIDPVANIATQKVYLFSGTKDATVRQSAMNGVRDFYRAAGVPTASLEYVAKLPAGHAFLSDRFGGKCAVTAAPFVNECKSKSILYDQPKAILTRLYGDLQPESATLSAAPVPFDQSAYASAFAGLAGTGFVYVPAACAAAPGCAVHVVFHGCGQGESDVGDAVYAKLGYNQWADSNRIVTLYPQVAKSPLNPLGCWDWFGYTGLAFQSRDGPQLAAVHKMVERLAAAP